MASSATLRASLPIARVGLAVALRDRLGNVPEGDDDIPRVVAGLENSRICESPHSSLSAPSTGSISRLGTVVNPSPIGRPEDGVEPVQPATKDQP